MNLKTHHFYQTTASDHWEKIGLIGYEAQRQYCLVRAYDIANGLQAREAATRLMKLIDGIQSVSSKRLGDKFLSLQLPGSQNGLRLQQIDQLIEKIEKFDKDHTVIVLHGGVMIGHKEYQGHQRVYACSFPHKTFRDFKHQDAVFMRPEGVDSVTFHPAPDNEWYGRCLLVFSFIVLSDDNVRYRMKCVLISTLEEYVCPEDDAAAGNWC